MTGKIGRCSIMEEMSRDYSGNWLSMEFCPVVGTLGTKMPPRKTGGMSIRFQTVEFQPLFSFGNLGLSKQLFNEIDSWFIHVFLRLVSRAIRAASMAVPMTVSATIIVVGFGQRMVYLLFRK
jgi:hypothetical protein